MAAIQLTQGGPADGNSYDTHWNGPFIEAHLVSDIGKKRHHNEDACAMCVPVDPALLDERGILFAVADGMGGASAGEKASRMAISAFFERYYTQLPASVPEMLGLALQDANQRVFNESVRKPEWHGMGTTLSSVVVDGDNAYVSQVGDSRVYVKRVREKLVQVTNDHSLVAEQVRHGFLRPEEAQKHSMKNLITRAVGIKNSVKYDLFSFKLKAGDALLICSDGLSNLVSDDDIDAALGAEDVECAARTLLERALTEGGSDNITAIVVRITEAPPAKAIHAGASEVPLESGSFLGKLKQILQGN